MNIKWVPQSCESDLVENNEISMFTCENNMPLFEFRSTNLCTYHMNKLNDNVILDGNVATP